MWILYLLHSWVVLTMLVLVASMGRGASATPLDHGETMEDHRDHLLMDSARVGVDQVLPKDDAVERGRRRNSPTPNNVVIEPTLIPAIASIEFTGIQVNHLTPSEMEFLQDAIQFAFEQVYNKDTPWTIHRTRILRMFQDTNKDSEDNRNDTTNLHGNSNNDMLVTTTTVTATMPPPRRRRPSRPARPTRRPTRRHRAPTRRPSPRRPDPWDEVWACCFISCYGTPDPTTKARDPFFFQEMDSPTLMSFFSTSVGATTTKWQDKLLSVLKLSQHRAFADLETVIIQLGTSTLDPVVAPACAARRQPPTVVVYG